MLKIESFKQAVWTPLLREGCHNVNYKALKALPHLSLTMLKFEPNATIDEHPADIEIDVYCLEGEGMVSMGEEEAPFKAGQHIRWIAGINHKLWTNDTPMVALMVEHTKAEA